MKAHLIDTHLLVPRSRSSANQGQISGSCFSKDWCFEGISVSQTHLVQNGFYPVLGRNYYFSNVSFVAANVFDLVQTKNLLFGIELSSQKASPFLTLSQTTKFRLFKTERVCGG